MNANNQILIKAAAAAMFACATLGAYATNMDSRSQSKVSNSMAKKWSSSQSQDGYEIQDSKRIVNIGSKKAGTCNVNIGTVQKGQKAPKEVIVTAKDVINVCN